jgi:hypothetical protein
MEQEDIQKIVDGIAPQLKDQLVITVNGKIDAIHKILERQNETMESFHSKVETHIDKDTIDKEKIFAWQDKAQPVVTMGENVQGFGKVSLYLLGFVSALIGAIVLIINLFKKN